jgi:hypothetical protein
VVERRKHATGVGVELLVVLLFAEILLLHINLVNSVAVLFCVVLCLWRAEEHEKRRVSMSDPLNSAVFGDGSNTISSKIASSGLADMGSGGMGGGVSKPGMGITTQLHTPLPRPSNVSTHSGGSSAASSMEAVNRSRSTVDPLASMTASVEQEEFEHQTPSPEVKAPPVDVYTSQFLSKIR